MVFVALIFLCLATGIAGWVVYHSILYKETLQQSSALKTFLTIFLTGFAAISVVLYILAIFRLFTGLVLVVLFVVLCLILIWRRLIHRPFFSCMVFCVALGCGATALSLLSPPYETIVLGDDTSIYAATAMQLSHSGGLSYKDPLLMRMTEEEQRELFRNRFPHDRTGTFARFPGGIRLLNPKEGTVTFSFYHLFPVWLAFAIQLLGSYGFLNVLSLFSILGLILLFALGRQLGGIPAGVSTCLIHFWYYPQFYFSHMAASEQLTQILFLAGMWILLSNMDADGVLQENHQRLAGALWGGLFLTRFDAMFYLGLGLLLAFSLIPKLARNIAKWKTLIHTLFFFMLLAIFHQLQTGEYLYLVETGDFINANSVVFLLITLLSSSAIWIQNHPLSAALVLAFLYAVIVFITNNVLSRPNFEKPLRIGGIVFTAFILFFMWKGHVSFPRVLSNVGWLSIYSSSWNLIAMFAGIGLFVLMKPARVSPDTKRILLLLFILSLIGYWMRPMAVTGQPWMMRRFLPIVIPLLFLLSSAGWYLALQKWISIRIAAVALYSVLVAATLWSFMNKTAVLLKAPLHSGVIAQTAQLAEKLPDNALVVLPDSLAALHLEVPLQYFFHRDTILLPTETRKGRTMNTMISFLSREIQQRPVVFLEWQNEGEGLQKHFDVQAMGAGQIEFYFLPRADRNAFPSTTRKAIYALKIETLHKKKEINPTGKDVVDED